MEEARSESLPRVRPVFANLGEVTPVHAVFDGNSAGRVFVDDLDAPRAAFLWTRWGFFYAAGSPSSGFIRELASRLESEWIPDSVRLGERWPVLFPSLPEWERWIPQLLRDRKILRLFRRSYRSWTPTAPSAARDHSSPTAAPTPSVPQSPPSGKQSPPSVPRSPKRLDAEFLDAHPPIRDSIAATWTSVERFLSEGSGWAVIDGSQVAAFCLSCFGGGGRLEVQVQTGEAWRGRGYATAAATAFLEDCRRLGRTPSWECWWNNEPSVRLAARLGFGDPVDHPVFWWEEPAAEGITP